MKPNTIKSFFELGTLHRHLLTDKRRKTKHPFLHKGHGCYGPYRAFLCKNGKLLLHYSGKLHTYSFWNDAKWRHAVGRDADESWKNINLIWGRAAYVRGGRQALKNGGWLQKRLFLSGCFGRSWKVIALASTFIPHIMDDAKNCPVIARAKIRSFIGWNGDMKIVDTFVKDWKWLGGVKVPFVPFTRPEGVAFKPQKRRDVYFVKAVSSASYHYPEAHRWLLSVQHRRGEIPHIDRDFHWLVTDGFRIKQYFDEAGAECPSINNLDVVTWSRDLHKLWDEQGTEIMRRRTLLRQALPTPGDNLIPELEEYRLKTRGEIIQAGSDCRHCVGSYAEDDNMAHYRKGNVVAQVVWETVARYDRDGNPLPEGQFRIYLAQCFDFANSVTEKSLAFRAEIEGYLAKLRPEEFEHRMSYWEQCEAERLHGAEVDEARQAVDAEIERIRREDEQLFAYPLPQRVAVEEFPF